MKRRRGLNIEFTKLKTDPDNNENAIDFRWSGVQGSYKKYCLEKLDWELKNWSGYFT